MPNDLTGFLTQQQELPSMDSYFENLSKQYGLLNADAAKYNQMATKMAEQAGLAQMQKRLQTEQMGKAARIKLEQQIAITQQQIAEKAARATAISVENTLKKSSNVQKAQRHKDAAQEIIEKRKASQQEYEDAIALSKANGESSQTRSAMTKKHNKEVMDSIKAERAEKEKASKLEASNAAKNNQNTIQGYKNIWAEFKTGSEEGARAAAGALGGTLSAIGNMGIDGLVSSLSKGLSDKAAASAAEVADIDAQINELKALGSNDSKVQAYIMELEKEKAEKQKQATIDANVAAAGKAGEKLVSMIGSAYKQAYKQAESFLMSSSAKINARLDGTDESFYWLTDAITTRLSTTPYIEVSKVLDKMKEAVEQGIAYNIESRAYLGTISEKLINTFDAFDANLLRLVRLQQQDSTAARLGLEAALNKFLNADFSDSSYLNDMYDTVTAAIVDASSQLNRDQSAEFEYIVQKWFGSLYSVGFSQETISEISKGINYLATGDVKSLSSNTQLQTLFAMSAANANLEYSELLLQGLDADKTNALLASMVSYLKTIAEDSDNQVVKAAYGDILNLSLSDMTALHNLTEAQINSIASNELSYNKMIATTQNKLNTLMFNMSLPEMLNNVYNNAIYGVASDMVNTPVTWTMNKMLEFMEEAKIDINIPSVSAAGFGVDLETSVTGLMRMGLGISQAFSLLTNVLGGLATGGGTDLSLWNIEEYISRGSGSSFQLSSVIGGTSNSATYATNMNKNDVQSSEMNAATDDAEETKEITNKNQPEATKTLDDLFKAIIGDQAESFAISRDVNINNSYISSVAAIRVWDNHLLRTQGNGAVTSSFLSVHDPAVWTELVNVFGKTSLIENTSKSLQTYIHTISPGAITALGTNIGNQLNTYVSTPFEKVFGEQSLLTDTGTAINVHDSAAGSFLSNLTDALTNKGATPVTNDGDNSLKVAVTNAADLQTVLQLNGTNIDVVIDTSVIAEALKTAMGTDKSEGGVLASQIAAEIAKKALTVQQKTGTTFTVKSNNTSGTSIKF